MTSKKLYPLVAILGIAAASGAAWWYQNKPAQSEQASAVHHPQQCWRKNLVVEVGN